MHIIVLNGSPKGELSITLQYVRYLEKKFTQRDWRSRVKNGLMLLMMKVPRFREEVYRRRMKGEMVKALQKVVEEA